MHTHTHTHKLPSHPCVTESTHTHTHTYTHAHTHLSFQDVIHHANRGASLSHIGSESLSGVVLDQLPLVSAACEGGALLPDALLTTPPGDATANAIKARVHPASRTLWEKLYEHLVLMVRHDVMRAQDAAGVFAPLLIGRASTLETQAQTLLTALLEKAPPDELQASLESSGKGGVGGGASCEGGVREGASCGCRGASSRQARAGWCFGGGGGPGTGFIGWMGHWGRAVHQGAMDTVPGLGCEVCH